MKILIIGGGAREHAVCWALMRSRRVGELFCAPGNAGTARLATNVPIGAEAVGDLAEWAAENAVGLTVVGPEAPLAAGLVDALARRGLRAFGPTARAAEIEASKCWAWGFMERQGIPAPRARECADVPAGLAAVEQLGLPVAIKADGLAAGKGVVLARTPEEARRALVWMLEQGGLGAAGRRVLVEEFLEGPELSVLAFADGRNVAPMPPARDYKRLCEGDRGPNTGGMGAYCPAGFAGPQLLERIRTEVLQPTMRGLAAEGRAFKGVLYAGLMLTADGPKVLEFNARLGDPESQVILPLLETDLLDVLEAVVEGDLGSIQLAWRPGAACGVVLASEGYPGSYSTGRAIRGLDDLPTDAMVFQAGTASREGEVVTAGGRVLTATGVGSDPSAGSGQALAEARRAAYELVRRISFEGCYYRGDIAADDAAAATRVQDWT
jgi:phosphoribosylamine--glycine ligase